MIGTESADMRTWSEPDWSIMSHGIPAFVIDAPTASEIRFVQCESMPAGGFELTPRARYPEDDEWARLGLEQFFGR